MHLVHKTGLSPVRNCAMLMNEKFDSCLYNYQSGGGDLLSEVDQLDSIAISILRMVQFSFGHILLNVS